MMKEETPVWLLNEAALLHFPVDCREAELLCFFNFSLKGVGIC